MALVTQWLFTDANKRTSMKPQIRNRNQCVQRPLLKVVVASHHIETVLINPVAAR
jgi:hypothetical protein